MIRDNTFQIRPLTRSGIRQSKTSVDAAQGARGGDATTNMADSPLIAINLDA
jgi:hypothetical protein